MLVVTTYKCVPITVCRVTVSELHFISCFSQFRSRLNSLREGSPRPNYPQPFILQTKAEKWPPLKLENVGFLMFYMTSGLLVTHVKPKHEKGLLHVAFLTAGHLSFVQ